MRHAEPFGHRLALAGIEPGNAVTAAPVDAARQLQRAVRAVLGQGGGTMLARLAGGGEIRIDCAVAGATASIRVLTATPEAARAVERAVEGIVQCCRRRGRPLTEVVIDTALTQPVAA